MNQLSQTKVKSHAKCWNSENSTWWSCKGLGTEHFGFKKLKI
jgi:hypothetical protein